MASKVTNDRKRNEMKEIMAGVFAKGWKSAEVAAVIGVTPSNISSWKAGKNMGTNEGRARLMALPGRDTSFAKEMMEKAVAEAKAALVGQTAKRDHRASEAGYQELLTTRLESNLHSIDYHTREFAAAQAREVNERTRSDIEYHTKYLAQYQAETPETVAAGAKTRQGHDVVFMTQVVEKAAKHLKDMEKIAAKW
jgi:transcriptional regulator with XRE-family HTH domain